MEKMLLGVTALLFLEKNGLPVLRSTLARDPEEAVSQAVETGFPVALKISSPDVVHKTEIGGVKVPLRDEMEVRDAFREIAGAFTAGTPGKRFDGVMVQGLGDGLELIVGVLTDRQFGPVLMFGLGGIFVEAMNDVSFRTIPLEPRDASEMIEELHCRNVLKNPRRGFVEIPAIENFILKVSDMVHKHPEIQEMDLNPVFISSKTVKICDARIKILS